MAMQPYYMFSPSDRIAQITSPCPPTSSRRASCPPSSLRPSSTDASVISSTCRPPIPSARSLPRPTMTRRRRRRSPRRPLRTTPRPTRRFRPSRPRRRRVLQAPPRRTLPRPMTSLPSPPSDIARDSSSATGQAWARDERLPVSCLRTTRSAARGTSGSPCRPTCTTMPSAVSHIIVFGCDRVVC